jgi:hypothetical protein
MIQNILPTTEIDAIREIILFAVTLLIRYFEKKKLKKKLNDE